MNFAKRLSVTPKKQPSRSKVIKEKVQKISYQVKHGVEEIHDRKFYEYTTIHGIREIMESQNLSVRLVWCALFVGSLGGMSYQLWTLFQHLREEPTASLLYGCFPTHLPTLVYCPEHFVNVSRARQLGVTAAMFSALLLRLSGRYDDLETALAFNKLQNESQVEEALQNVITRTGNIDNLFHAIAYDPFEILSGAHPAIAEGTRMLTSSNGPCYRYRSNITLDYFSVTGFEQILTFVDHGDYEEYGDYYQYLDNYFFLGDMGDNIRPTSERYIRGKAGEYMMAVSYRLKETVNLRRSPCLEHGTYRDHVQCLYSCMRRVCRDHGFCEPYVPGENQSDFRKLCKMSSVQADKGGLDDRCETELHSTISETCYSLKRGICKQPCKYETYRFAIIPQTTTGVSANNRTKMWVNFDDPTSSQCLKETQIYTTTNMISQIGGAISLWCGASMLSVVQLVFYAGVNGKASIRRKKEIT